MVAHSDAHCITGNTIFIRRSFRVGSIDLNQHCW